LVIRASANWNEQARRCTQRAKRKRAEIPAFACLLCAEGHKHCARAGQSARLLRKGKSQGTVRRDLNPDETASFLIATVEGYATLAKNAQDAKVWKAGIRNIVGWLRSLRTPDNFKRRLTASRAG